MKKHLYLLSFFIIAVMVNAQAKVVIHNFKAQSKKTTEDEKLEKDFLAKLKSRTTEFTYQKIAADFEKIKQMKAELEKFYTKYPTHKKIDEVKSKMYVALKNQDYKQLDVLSEVMDTLHAKLVKQKDTEIQEKKEEQRLRMARMYKHRPIKYTDVDGEEITIH